MATFPEYSFWVRHTRGLEFELVSIACSPLLIRSPWVHVLPWISHSRDASKKPAVGGRFTHKAAAPGRDREGYRFAGDGECQGSCRLSHAA